MSTNSASLGICQYATERLSSTKSIQERQISSNITISSLRQAIGHILPIKDMSVYLSAQPRIGLPQKIHSSAMASLYRPGAGMRSLL